MGWTHHDGIAVSNFVTSNMAAGTAKATTLYGNAYNLENRVLIAKTGAGKYSVPNITTTDSIDSAHYFRFSSAVLKTGGTIAAANLKITATHTVSVAGITSNSVVLLTWIDKF